MTEPINPRVIGLYDQYKSETSDRIDAMVAKWRQERADGRSDFDIFGRQIAAMDGARPSFERLAVMVAFMVERLAAQHRTEQP